MGSKEKENRNPSEGEKSESDEDEENQFSFFSSTNKFAALSKSKMKAKPTAAAATAPKYQIGGRMPTNSSSTRQQQQPRTKTAEIGAKLANDRARAAASQNTNQATASAFVDVAQAASLDNFWASTTGNQNGQDAPLGFPDFLRRFHVHLACSFCYDASKNQAKIMAHVCHYSVFLCRRRVDEIEEDEVEDYKRPLDWQVVREFPGHKTRLRLCADVRQCVNGLDCPSAHSELEMAIWQEEQSTGIRAISTSFRNTLLAATIMESTKIETLPFSGGDSDLVSIWLGCRWCATFVRKQYYVLRYWNHQCAANRVFIRYDFKPPAQKEFWIFVRSSPANSTRRGDFDLCHHIEQGCWRGYLCKFPHTNFEGHLWTLDKRGEFNLDHFLNHICKKSDPAAIDWKPITYFNANVGRQLNTGKAKDGIETTADRQSCSSSMKTDNDSGKPESIDWRCSGQSVSNVSTRTRTSSSQSNSLPPRLQLAAVRDTASVQNRGDGDRHARCPFNIRLICRSCFTKSGAVVYQNGTYCGAKNANHTWQQHKGFAILDDSGKALLLRDLPHGILRNRQLGKPCVVRMCKRMEQYKNCGVALCDYAHYDLERRCWLWLLKTGANLSEVAERLNKAATEQKPAAARATVAAPPPMPMRMPMSMAARATASTSAPTLALRPAVPWTVGAPAATAGPSLLALEQSRDEAVTFYCYLCDKQLQGHVRFDEHVNAQLHQSRFRMVEENHIWRFRPPPSPPPFRGCDRHIAGGKCVYSMSAHNRCANAHSKEELDEWIERLDFLKRALARKSNADLVELKKKIGDAKELGKSILSSCVDDVDISCNGNPEAAVTEKGKPYVWKFTVVVAEGRMERVILLDYDNALYFRLQSPFASTQNEEVESGDVFADETLDGLYEVFVEFKGSNTPQTFTQRVAFDFGRIPIVYRELVVHSGLDQAALLAQTSLRYLLTSSEDRWTPENAEIIWISKERSCERMDVANVVANLNFTINESNYFSLLKQWLFAEEYKRQSILDDMQFKGVQVTAVPFVIDDYGERLFPAKEGNFFVEVPLKETLSEDVDVINLLREYCQNAFISLTKPPTTGADQGGGKRMVYEVDIVNKQRFKKEGVFCDRVNLLLNYNFVRHARLWAGSKATVDIQFNLSVKQFRHWLRGLERLQERQLAPLIFPDLLAYYPDYASGRLFQTNRPKILNLPYLQRLWKNQYNEEQCQVIEHVLLCAVDRKSWIPPLVVFGAFGTGKTRTIAAATAVLLTDKTFEHTKILICTHANTTADIYINLLLEHTRLHEYQLKKILWRVFHRYAKSEKTQFVRFTTDSEGQMRPEPLTAEKLAQIRVVICTFSASDKLLKILDENENENDQVAFTHIFIDEAAQALELETVLPLCLAKRTTCVVVAGDHHQIRPSVYLPQAKELSRSYLERLYYFYDKQKSSMAPDARAAYRFPSILFNKNYRCHSEILSFISENFYGDAKCLVPRVEGYDDSVIKSLHFVVSESDEEVGRNASICNRGEAEAVADQVADLWHHWPKTWGEPNIGVAVPYTEQGNIIKDMLRMRHVSLNPTRVDVVRVIQMQGKEYKAVIISTVRGPTQLQLAQAIGDQRARNLAFLDDARLINTAMTRAKYTVIVVGNPTVLCALGACREIWYRYIERCARMETLWPSSVSWNGLDQRIGFVRANTKASKKEDIAETVSADDLLIEQLTRKTRGEEARK